MLSLKHLAGDIFRSGLYLTGIYPRQAQLYSALKMYEFSIVDQHVRASGAAEILDLCCGTGIQTQLLARAGRMVTGIDSDPQQIRDALWHVKRSWRKKSVNFEIARAEKIPSKTHAFDAVVCLCALEHLPDPRIALAEIYRVLRPGGMVYLTVDSLANVTDDELLYRHRRLYDVYNYFDIDGLTDILVAAGFRVESAYPFLCSDAALAELRRCMDSPQRISFWRTLSLLRRLRRLDKEAGSDARGLFVFAAARSVVAS